MGIDIGLQVFVWDAGIVEMWTLVLRYEHCWKDMGILVEIMGIGVEILF